MTTLASETPPAAAITRRGLSIRIKLFVAMGGIAAMTVIASVVAGGLFWRTGATIAVMTEERIPVMAASLASRAGVGRDRRGGPGAWRR
jgi:hypothetical protein